VFISAPVRPRVKSTLICDQIKINKNAFYSAPGRPRAKRTLISLNHSTTVIHCVCRSRWVFRQIRLEIILLIAVMSLLSASYFVTHGFLGSWEQLIKVDLLYYDIFGFKVRHGLL
jgi:hypothetical protein